MTEQDAIAYVTLHAQTASYPSLEAADVQKIVRDNVRATIWEADKAYKIGMRVQPTTPNGHFFECVQTGTSGAVEPEWVTKISYPVTEDESELIWEECASDFDGNLYNLRNAIHAVWTLKAAMSATDFDVRIDGQAWARSQIHAHCLEMARSFYPID